MFAPDHPILPDIVKVLLQERLKEYLICWSYLPNCSPLYFYPSSFSPSPKYITAIQNASCSLCFYILCLCICFFGPHGVLKRMGRWDPSSCQSKKMMISLLKTGKVLMFFIKAEILFFLLPVKWRGHNCKSSGAPSLVMLTAPLFTDSISHENFICFNSRGKPTKRNKRSSCFFHIFAVLKPLLKHVLLFVYLLIPLSLLLSMQML